MRRAFAIVFCLLLVFGQWAGAMPSAPERLAKACNDCACHQPSCCVSSAPAAPTPAPQAPAPETRSTEQQLLTALASVAVTLAPPLSTGYPGNKVTQSVPAAPAVPLYCQNCIFLI